MLYAIYFIYGLCVMFYFMMAWLFYRKDKELLSRLVTVLMLVIGMQCLKESALPKECRFGVTEPEVGQY